MVDSNTEQKVFLPMEKGEKGEEKGLRQRSGILTLDLKIESNRYN